MVAKKYQSIVNGLGECGAFFRCHPILNILYFGIIICITMFSNHPIVLFQSFITALFYSVLLNGKKAMRFNIFLIFPVILITTLFNALSVHNGVTVLFCINGSNITLEAVAFGIVQGIMLAGNVIWFMCFSTIVTEDKFIYLFGRKAPVVALTISMILRFIPMFKNRFHEISIAQRCMGKKKSKNIFHIMRQFGKEISILLTWSLEASVESADSMEARGYGLAGRTSFHLFKMSKKEYCFLVLILILGVFCIAGCTLDYTNIDYYPKIMFPQFSIMHICFNIAFFLLMWSVIIIDIRSVK